MNNIARRMIMDRRRGYNDYSGEYRGEMEYRGDYRMTPDYTRGRDYNYDGRRGVKGTGRYGIGGSRYYGRDSRSERDYDDYNHEYDYAESEHLRLSKEEMREWKRHLENADGSLGEHFSMEQLQRAAEKIGVTYNGYTEKDLCMVANMLYSDYCEALKAYIPQDKEAIIYTRMARAFLEDEDAPEGSEKLALYYYCIVKDDEE